MQSLQFTEKATRLPDDRFAQDERQLLHRGDINGRRLIATNDVRILYRSDYAWVISSPFPNPSAEEIFTFSALCPTGNLIPKT